MNTKQLRFWGWMVQGYISKHKIKLVGLMLLTGFSIALIPFVSTAFTSNDEEHYIEGVVGSYSKKNLPRPVLEYISQSLVKIDETGTAVPHIAKEIIATDSAKTFIVTLRDDINWHSGEKITSKDITYNISNVQLEKPNDQTLVFKLEDSYVPFPTLLTEPLTKFTTRDELLGVGEYHIVKEEYVGNFLSRMELESASRNPKRLTIKFYATEKEAETAFKLGQIDGLRISENSSLNSWNNTVQYKKPNSRRFIGLFFNMKDGTVGGKDASLRHAMGLGLNDIPNTVPFEGPFINNSWATTTRPAYRRDAQRAQQNMSKFFNATNNKEKKISVTITTLNQYIKEAEFIKLEWAKLGIETNISIQDEVPKDFQILLVGQELPADPDQYSLWHSSQKNTNITRYENLRVDKNLEDARKTLDVDIRKQKYADFEKIIHEEVPVIYLYQPFNSYIMHNRASNNPSIRDLKEFTQ